MVRVADRPHRYVAEISPVEAQGQGAGHGPVGPPDPGRDDEGRPRLLRRPQRHRQHRDVQPNGILPTIAPGVDPGVGEPTATAGWGDGHLTVTHTLWKKYGDTAVIDENWKAMTDDVEIVMTARAASGGQIFCSTQNQPGLSESRSTIRLIR